MVFNPHKVPEEWILLLPFYSSGSHMLSNLPKVTLQKAVAQSINLRQPNSKAHVLSIISCCFSRTLEQKEKEEKSYNKLCIKSTQDTPTMKSRSILNLKGFLIVFSFNCHAFLIISNGLITCYLSSKRDIRLLHQLQ